MQPQIFTLWFCDPIETVGHMSFDSLKQTWLISPWHNAFPSHVNTASSVLMSVWHTPTEWFIFCFFHQIYYFYINLFFIIFRLKCLSDQCYSNRGPSVGWFEHGPCGLCGNWRRKEVYINEGVHKLPLLQWGYIHIAEKSEQRILSFQTVWRSVYWHVQCILD